jgi:hypothetical protein
MADAENTSDLYKDDVEQVDPLTVQKTLLYVADKISGDFSKESSYTNNLRDNILLLRANPDSNESATNCLIEQSLLSSGSPIINKQMAHEVYRDIDENNGGKQINSRILDASVTHNIIFRRNIQNKGDRNYYFNLTNSGQAEVVKIKKKSVEDIKSGKQKKLSSIPFFSKLEIENKAKDAFTAHSVYSVKLTIHFDDMQDVLRNDLEAIASDGTKFNFSLMNLIYPTIDTSEEPNEFTTSVINTKNDSGIILTQTLNVPNYVVNIDNNKFYEQQGSKYWPITNEIFQNDKHETPLTRIFHLSYSKHNFNMFAKENAEQPETVPYQHELTIDFVSYEADIGNKPFIESSITGIQVSDSLYSLLKNISFSELLLDSSVGPGVNAYDYYIDNITRVEKAISDAKELATITKQTANIKGDLNQIKRYIFDMKKALMFYMDKNLTIYNMQIPYDTLSEVNESLTAGEILSEINYGSAASTAVTAGTGMAFIPGAGWVAPAVAGAALVTNIAIQATDLSKKLKTNKGILNINSIRNKYKTPTSLGIGTLRFIPGTLTEYGQVAKKIRESVVATENKADEAALKKNVNVKFIMLGDVISLLFKGENNKNLNLIFGGAPVKFGNVWTYVNFYEIPIYLPVFLKFLKKHILDTQGLNYSTSAFISNILEEIIKPMFKLSSRDPDTNILSILPSTLKMYTSTHINNKHYKNIFYGSGSTPRKIHSLNPDNQAVTEELKKNFQKSKQFSSADAEFKKIIFLGAENSFDYTNIYTKWENFILHPDDVKSVFGVEKSIDFQSEMLFQEYVNKSLYIPSFYLKDSLITVGPLKGRNVKFSRIDNANLYTGQIIANGSALRMPYNVDLHLHHYMAWFMDTGNYFFIQPSDLSKKRKYTGFNGLYVANSMKLTYDFPQKGMTSPVTQFDFKISGRHISFCEKNVREDIINERIK